MIAQILAVAIFLIMFGLIISEKFERHVVTLVSGAIMLVLVFGVIMHSMSAIWESLNIQTIFTISFWYEAGTAAESTTGINWETIIFIAGMMVMVEGMAKAGFFRWLCMTIAKAVKYRVVPIFVAFMIMSSALAMFIDSITVILFLAAVTIELAQLLKFNPVPMILSEIFCANLGGSATMCGDPPNIIIGTSLHYSFADFIKNTGAIAGICLIVTLIFFYIFYRNEWKKSDGAGVDVANMPDPSEAIVDRKAFIISSVIFAVAVVLLVTHAQTGLTVAFIGFFIAAVTILTSSGHRIDIIKGVDYRTLLFFTGLFVVVSGLEETGVLEIIASFIGTISGGNKKVMVIIILWISACASAVIDNIPFAATMIPVIKSLSAATGMDLSVLAWALSIGTDIGGSATPIGASANVVGTSVAAKEGYPVGWGEYCKAAIPATVLVLVVATACILVRYF